MMRMEVDSAATPRKDARPDRAKIGALLVRAKST